MDNTKAFFYHTTIPSGNVVTGEGHVSLNLNLRSILGSKYDKFDAFNLSLEGYAWQGGSASGDDKSALCLHVAGFPWMNCYYDSLQQYSSSRVIEVISHNMDVLPDDTNMAYFVQNVHRIPFYKPATPIIQRFTLFVTSPSGAFAERLGAGSITGYVCVFAITGIDAYCVRKIPRPLVYRGIHKPNPQLVLNSNSATSIDPIDTTATKKRIFRFADVNWRQIIGHELYDRYEKFALVTRKITIQASGSSYGTSFYNFTVCLSGSNLRFEETSNYPFLSNNSATTQLHEGNAPVVVALMSGAAARRLRDVYIENVFYRPTQDIGNITVHYSNQDNITLAAGTYGPNLTNSIPYPNTVLHFEIIPVVDVA